MSKRIYQNILLVSVLTIIAKLLGFLREIALGNIFGVGIETDLYFYAFKISIFMFLSAGGIITTALIPPLVEDFSHSKKEKAFDLANSVLSILLLGAMFFTLLVVFFAKPIGQVLSPYTGNDLIILARLIRVMFASSLFFPFIYVFMSILHVNNVFIPNNLSSVVYNLILILYLLMIGSRYNILGFSYIILLGWLFQFIVLIPSVKKLGYKFEIKIFNMDKRIKEIFKKALPLFMIISTFGLLNLGDTIAASQLEAGSTSTLNFAFSLYGAFSTTLILAVSTVLFPEITKQIKSRVQDEVLKDFLLKQIRPMIILFIPMTVGVLAIGDDLIRLLFSFTNEFTEANYVDTYRVLGAYFIGFVAFGVYELLNKVYLAKNNLKLPFIISTGAVVINLVLNYLVTPIAGTTGIAFVTSISLILSAGIYWTYMGLGKGSIKLLLKVVSSSLMMWLIIDYINYFNAMDVSLMSLIIKFVIGICVYFVGVVILRVEEILLILKLIWRKFNEKKI